MSRPAESPGLRPLPSLPPSLPFRPGPATADGGALPPLPSPSARLSRAKVELKAGANIDGSKPTLAGSVKYVL